MFSQSTKTTRTGKRSIKFHFCHNIVAYITSIGTVLEKSGKDSVPLLLKHLIPKKTLNMVGIIIFMNLLRKEERQLYFNLQPVFKDHTWFIEIDPRH